MKNIIITRHVIGVAMDMVPGIFANNMPDPFIDFKPYLVANRDINFATNRFFNIFHIIIISEFLKTLMFQRNVSLKHSPTPHRSKGNDTEYPLQTELVPEIYTLLRSFPTRRDHGHTLQ